MLRRGAWAVDVLPIQAKKVHFFSGCGCGCCVRRSRGLGFLGGSAGVASLAGEREHLIVRGLTLLAVAPTVWTSVGPAWLCRTMRQKQKEGGRERMRQRREKETNKAGKVANEQDNKAGTGY